MYVGICSERGIVVADDQAFDYALDRIKNGTQDEKKEFVEFFFSDNWKHEKDDEDAIRISVLNMEIRERVRKNEQKGKKKGG